MKHVNILHLYSKTLDLIGDFKNLDALCMRIRECGCNYSVSCVEYGEKISLEGYNFIYIGHGKCRNLSAVSEHIIQYREEFVRAFEAGTIFLVTGSARLLFGKSFETLDGKTHEALGLFDYTGKEFDGLIVHDELLHPVFAPEETVFGCVNRSENLYFEGENPSPLFTVEMGYSDNEKIGGVEGTLCKNFFGTWSLGPVLIRNPVMMREILRRLLGEDYLEGDYSLEQEALDRVLLEVRESVK
ncbi:MAG TPA: hypothetical protein PKY19_04530 [Oscillospiraceae bacterium]|nr:hypothetical protein [Oscillospiraceae bacterium]HXK77732.1 hypothetical protein [Oscillospiraceae bacterium]